MTKLIAHMDFPKQDKTTRHFGVVLVDKESKYGDEFVTWIKYLDGARETASGNYFRTLGAAMSDFNTRCVRYIEFVNAKEMQERKAKDLNEGEGI